MTHFGTCSNVGVQSGTHERRRVEFEKLINARQGRPNLFSTDGVKFPQIPRNVFLTA
jgi:hypothetical protein